MKSRSGSSNPKSLLLDSRDLGTEVMKISSSICVHLSNGLGNEIDNSLRTKTENAAKHSVDDVLFGILIACKE